MQNKVFFPQTSLDKWLIDGSIEVAGNELTILAEARRYRVAEAVFVQREVTGLADENDLIGKVKSKLFLEELGAEILEGSMIIGNNAYDVIQGWLGAPTSTWADHAMSPERKRARSAPDKFEAEEPRTDEDLLARFLNRNL